MQRGKWGRLRVAARGCAWLRACAAQLSLLWFSHSPFPSSFVGEVLLPCRCLLLFKLRRLLQDLGLDKHASLQRALEIP